MLEQADKPPRALAEKLGREEAAGSALVDLAQRRIGRNNGGERADLEASADRERPGLDQLAGMRAQDRGAENAAVVPGQHLDETVGRALGLGTVVLMVRPAQDREVAGM